MAQQSKFSGALARLHEKPVPEEPVAELPVTEAPPLVPATSPRQPAKGRGRPPGKRSDPDFMNTTVLLRKTTKRIAARLLEDIQSGQDLSELVEQLLTQWIKRKS